MNGPLAHKKWRWISATSGLVIAVSLFVLRSYHLWVEISSRDPRGFYDGCCLEFDRWETKVLNTLNIPALILSSPVRAWWDRPLYIGRGFGLFTSDIAYLVFICLF